MNDGRKLIVSFWGSLGSNAMNRAMAEFLALESAKEPFYHIHGVGEICWKPMQQWMHDDGLEITEHPALDVREYIYDMATVMRAADLVICRAGASTLSELTALGVPAILGAVAQRDEPPSGKERGAARRPRRGARAAGRGP